MAREAHAMMIITIMMMFGGKPNCVKCVLFLIYIYRGIHSTMWCRTSLRPGWRETLTNMFALSRNVCAQMDVRICQHALSIWSIQFCKCCVRALETQFNFWRHHYWHCVICKYTNTHIWVNLCVCVFDYITCLLNYRAIKVPRFRVVVYFVNVFVS